MISQPKEAVWEKVIHTALDMLFPPLCAGCKKHGELLCKACKENALYKGNECFFCGIKAGTSGICATCKKIHSLESLSWQWRYSTDEARAVIYAFKYRKKRALASALAGELLCALNNVDLPENLILMPMPLHPQKEAERGFNQAELIARYIDLPMTKGAVSRILKTPPQARAASRQERIKQIHGAFEVIKSESVRNKNILIVDDVATTGATICELARMLKNAGANKIYATVVAHG